MSKEAFIRRLRELLAGLPQSEAEEAIQYYEDYFADAGEENEAKVIEELGSPEKVAANIRADLGMAGTQGEGASGNGGTGSCDGKGTYSGNGSTSTQGGQSSGAGGGYNYGSTGFDGDRYNSDSYSGSYSGRAGGSRYEEPSKEKHTALWVVLAICTCYVWIPLVLAAVILVFAAIVVVCALSLAFGVTAFAIGVTGIALIGVAVVKMFVSPAAGLIMLGSGLIMAGLTIFFIYLVGLLFGKAIPSFFGWIGSLGRKARRRRGGM